MFTGLIEEIGELRRIHKQGQAMVLTVGARRILDDVKLGDSIAVNGVCLTVISFDAVSVSMDVMPETFRKTNLKQLSAGDPVNLERAMSMASRFGGHIVQGHVDSVGTIVGRRSEENAVVFHVEPEDPEKLKYVLAGGSITIDGISLTVVDVTDHSFSVSIIPHTLAETVLQHKHPGDTVNLECDILGKYVERLLNFQKPGAAGGKTGRLTQAFLQEHGFM
ncbi:riboflavin synthase [Paenibacillus chartarius]|uniref:Riboflavin synthase n=1 Tax=Paenibacillus chartarius TaxID=747481 RepID=A0ABV6DNQ1_9BACL